MIRALAFGICLLAAASAPADAAWDTCATDAPKDALVSCSALLRQFAGKGVFWAMALRHRAQAHYDLKDYDSALRDYTDLIASDFALADDFEGRADTFGWLERWPESLKDAQEALRRDPTNPLYKWAVALAMHQLDQHATAVDMLIPLKEVYPGDDAVLSKLGWSLYKLGRYDEALAAYDELLKVTSKRGDYWLEKGLIEEAAGKHDAAEQSFTTALEIAPNDAYAYYRRAGLRLWLGNHEMALADARKAMELDPQDLYRLRRAAALVNTGHFDEASADLARLAANTDYKADTAFLRGRILARQGEDQRALASFEEAAKLDPELIDAHYDAGMSLWNLGRLEEAERSFTLVLEHWTNDAVTYYRRGGVRLQRDDLDGALADSNASIAADPDSALALEQRAAVYNRKMLYVKTEANCRKALAIDPALFDARLYCAWSAWSLDGFERAIADYDALLKAAPDDVQIIGERAELLYDLGRIDESRSEAERAVKMQPSSSVALRHRGSISERDRQFEAAFRDYNRSVGTAPEDGWAYEARAYWLLAEGQVAKALADCRTMLDKLPKTPASYRCLARASWEAEEPQDAYDALAKALALNANYGPGYYDRGRMLMDQGRYDEARSDFSRAIELSHRKADSLLRRGDAAYNLGDRADAQRDYEAALGLARGPLIMTARQRLTRVGGGSVLTDDPDSTYPGRRRTQ